MRPSWAASISETTKIEPGKSCWFLDWRAIVFRIPNGLAERSVKKNSTLSGQTGLIYTNLLKPQFGVEGNLQISRTSVKHKTTWH